MSIVEQIIDRACRDPEFAARLRRDPVGAASSAGYTVSMDELTAALGIVGASEVELTEALDARVSHSTLIPPSNSVLMGRTGAGGYPDPDD